MTWRSGSGGGRVTPLPRGWHITRRRVLERDGGRCTWLRGRDDGLPVDADEAADVLGGGDAGGRRCTTRATDVDHVGDRDQHDDDWLRSLCAPHHMHRTGVKAKTEYWARTKRRAEPHPGFIG